MKTATSHRTIIWGGLRSRPSGTFESWFAPPPKTLKALLDGGNPAVEGALPLMEELVGLRPPPPLAPSCEEAKKELGAKIERLAKAGGMSYDELWKSEWSNALVTEVLNSSQLIRAYSPKGKRALHAAICLAILETRPQENFRRFLAEEDTLPLGRPGGYTLKDIGLFAGAMDRGTQRTALRVLLRAGFLRKRRERGRQPRYHYVGPRLFPDYEAWINIRTAQEIARRAVGTITSRVKVVWDLPRLQGYLVGSPEAPSWLLELWDEAFGFARTLVYSAMGIARVADYDAIGALPVEDAQQLLEGTKKFAGQERLESMCKIAGQVYERKRSCREEFHAWAGEGSKPENRHRPVLVAPFVPVVHAAYTGGNVRRFKARSRSRRRTKGERAS